jgi:hypothetical protein
LYGTGTGTPPDVERRRATSSDLDRRACEGSLVASAALVIWLVTGSTGLSMMGVAVGFSRPVGEPANTHWPSWLMFAHPTFAGAGVTAWMVYMAYDYRALARVSLADLVLVAALGDVLLVPWLVRADHGAAGRPRGRLSARRARR